MPDADMTVHERKTRAPGAAKNEIFVIWQRIAVTIAESSNRVWPLGVVIYRSGEPDGLSFDEGA